MSLNNVRLPKSGAEAVDWMLIGLERSAIVLAKWCGGVAMIVVAMLLAKGIGETKVPKEVVKRCPCQAAKGPVAMTPKPDAAASQARVEPVAEPQQAEVPNPVDDGGEVVKARGEK